MQCLGVQTNTSDTTSGGMYIAPTPDASIINLEFITTKCQMALGLDLVLAQQLHILSTILSSRALICMFSRSFWIFKRSNGYVDIL